MALVPTRLISRIMVADELGVLFTLTMNQARASGVANLYEFDDVPWPSRAGVSPLAARSAAVPYTVCTFEPFTPVSRSVDSFCADPTPSQSTKVRFTYIVQ